MEETNKTPAENAGEDTQRLLAAIRSNPETAHVLAEIALGGDASELLATLLPKTEDASEPAAPSQPAFLEHVRDSFWD